MKKNQTRKFPESWAWKAWLLPVKKLYIQAWKIKMGVQNPKKVVKWGSEKRFCSVKKKIRHMAKNSFHAIFGFTFKKNTEINRLTTKVLWHFHFLARDVNEISKKTNVGSWSENMKTRTCLMFLDNFTRAMVLNSCPNMFCSLRSVLALQGTLVILIQYDKNIWVSLSSF